MTRKKDVTASAVSNGTRLHLSPIPGSGTVASRRWADLHRQLERERGGAAALTVTQREAIRVYCTLAVQHEAMTTDLVSGKPVDVEALGQLGDRLDRAARRIGPVKAAERPSLRDRFAKRDADGAAA